MDIETIRRFNEEATRLKEYVDRCTEMLIEHFTSLDPKTKNYGALAFKEEILRAAAQERLPTGLGDAQIAHRWMSLLAQQPEKLQHSIDERGLRIYEVAD